MSYPFFIMINRVKRGRLSAMTDEYTKRQLNYRLYVLSRVKKAISDVYLRYAITINKKATGFPMANRGDIGIR